MGDPPNLQPPPGFSGTILVRRHQDVYGAGYGLADKRLRSPCGLATRYQIASVSKQFTAVAALQLVEAAQIALTDPIRPWFPGAPSTWTQITVEHLLTHTSGLLTWEDIPDFSLFEALEADAVFNAFAHRELAHHPGARWRYSSPGYVFLAQLVERITGMRFAEVLEDRILGPLGLRATAAGQQTPTHPMQAQGYERGRKSKSFDLDQVGLGAGDIWSTADDLNRWNIALFDGRLLDPALVLRATSPLVGLPVGRRGTLSIGYGYGWFVAETTRGRMLFHTGGNAGFSAINAVFPDSGITIVVLSNDGQTDVRTICEDMFDAVSTLALMGS